MSSSTDDQTESKSTVTSEYVKLNVGGMLFQTTVGTLTKFKENMLDDMFSGEMEKTIDKEGWVLIDRCGKHFGMIINFLRDGVIPLPEVKRELAELRAEANFYRISELVYLCDQELDVSMKIHEILPSTIIVLAKPWEESVKNRLKKPIILLHINASKDFPTKNIEFFETFAENFYKHILFVRYASNNLDDNLICTWFFYAIGGKESDKILLETDEFPETNVRNAVEKLMYTLIPKPK